MWSTTEEIKEAFHSDFKICETIVAAGFFLILLIECVAIQCHGETNAQHNDESRPILSEQASNHNETSCDAEVHDHGNIFESSSTLRSLIFLLALSVHSLFEGFAVGIQETVSETLQLLLAIGIHKCVLAFSFSTNLARQYNMTMLMKVLFLVIFSISSPIGVAIAIAIAVSAQDSNHALNGILQSLASGTFLYIIFIEIVPTLQLHKHRGTLKALVMMVGFCVMIGLQ
ncbi:zinc transporter ZIP1-like, partial [Antedon mediterranea]|uniref:zinc transporter ZIP1-like n=1 Tax=Antedon mediterranea TaxID=105859 RepID=UPI003AF599C2